MEADWDQKPQIKPLLEEDEGRQLDAGGAWGQLRPLRQASVEQGLAPPLDQCCHLLSHCVQFNGNTSKLLGVVLLGSDIRGLWVIYLSTNILHCGRIFGFLFLFYLVRFLY